MSVLVDSSIWVDYFRAGGQGDTMDLLIEENLIVTNDLVLSELIPPLTIRHEKKLISLLREIKKQPLAIDWDGIVQMQLICLKNGINGVGIPDLIIAQNTIQGRLKLLSNDKHFSFLAKHTGLEIFL
jgi:predicted nucleic acid-binding protein